MNCFDSKLSNFRRIYLVPIISYGLLVYDSTIIKIWKKIQRGFWIPIFSNDFYIRAMIDKETIWNYRHYINQIELELKNLFLKKLPFPYNKLPLNLATFLAGPAEYQVQQWSACSGHHPRQWKGEAHSGNTPRIQTDIRQNEERSQSLRSVQ